MTAALSYSPTGARSRSAPPSAWTKTTPIKPYGEVSGRTMSPPVAVPLRRTQAASEANRALQLVVVQVRDAVKSSETDFVTMESLEEQLGLSKFEVRLAVSVLGGDVRRPIGQAAARFPTALRWTARGLTAREKWWKFRAIAGHTNL